MRTAFRHGLSAMALLVLPALTAHAAPGDTTLIAEADSAYSSLNYNGRFVVYGASSWTPSVADLYVHDRWSGKLEPVNDGGTNWSYEGGAPFARPAMSANGRYVAFCSNDDYIWPAVAWIRDRVAGTLQPLMANGRRITGDSDCVSALSADGRFVAFASPDPDIVEGDTNDRYDIYVLDRSTGAARRVSVASNGTQANDGSYFGTLSASGRFVVFSSYASNLVPGDTNGVEDVFLHDRTTGVTERVNVDSQGSQSKGQVDYTFDVSANGRYVAFASSSSTLVPDDTNAANDPRDSASGFDVFVRDRMAGSTERVSLGLDGQQGNGPSKGTVSMSNDARIVAFMSLATNLVPGDYGDDADVYLRDRWLRRTERVSVHSNGAESTNPSRSSSHSVDGSVSGDGQFVSFSSGTDLAPGASRHGSKVYVHEVGGTDYWAYAVRPSKATFGAQPLASSTTRRFEVENSGTRPLRIAVLELRGEDKLQFRRADDCPDVLAVDATCTVAVTFRPNSVGTKSAVLKVVFDTGATRPVRTVTLTGSGVSS